MSPEQPEPPNKKRLVIAAGAFVFVLLLGAVFFSTKKDRTQPSTTASADRPAGATFTGTGKGTGQPGTEPGINPQQQLAGRPTDAQPGLPQSKSISNLPASSSNNEPVQGASASRSSGGSDELAQGQTTPSESSSSGSGSSSGAQVQGASGVLGGAFARFMGIFGGVSKKAAQTEATSDTGSNSQSGRGIASSTLSGSATSTTSPLVKAPAPGPELRDGCVTVSFIHKKAQGHTSDEVCTHHKNLIRIKHPNPSSICIRVNKTPVKFEAVKGKSNEFIIGAVAGPKAEISATYCVGSATCKEKCVVPKDDFLTAIGGEDLEGKNPQVAQWDAEDRGGKDTDVYGNLDADTKRELDRLDQGDGAEETARLFQDWIRGAELPACGTQQAALSGSKE